AEPEQPVIDEHAHELIADRGVQERCDDRRIDAAREGEQHAVLADPAADALDVVGDDVLRRPRRRAAAHVAHEARQDLETVLGVRDLGMKLQAVDPPLRVRDRGERRVTRSRDRLEARRQALDPVAVAHPDPERSVGPAEPGEERIVVGQLDLRVAVLALRRRANLAAEPRGERPSALPPPAPRRPPRPPAARPPPPRAAGAAPPPPAPAPPGPPPPRAGAPPPGRRPRRRPPRPPPGEGRRPRAPPPAGLGG